MKEEYIYELVDVDPDEGVSIFEIAPVLMQFGQLVRDANTVLDFGLEIDIRVKPFREGSWITEFVLHGKVIGDLFSFLKKPDGQALGLLMALLGLTPREGIVGFAKIIRFSCGKVRRFRHEHSGTVTYINEAGDQLTVTLPEHQLVQSPLVQVNYYNSLIAPLDKFPTATAVSIHTGNKAEAQRFTDTDKPCFREYLNTELAAEDIEENVTHMHGVFLKPKRGPYSGEEQEYSFLMGKSTLWPVTIEDERFLEQLRSGDVRPYSRDLLKADVEIRQRKSARSNKLVDQYAITRVIEYHKYEKPEQFTLENLDSAEDC